MTITPQAERAWAMHVANLALDPRTADDIPRLMAVEALAILGRTA